MKKEIMPNLPIFETSDIYLASALRTKGLKLLDIRTDNESDRGIFMFEDTPNREKLVRDYRMGNLEGNLKSYSKNWVDLKMMVTLEVNKKWT